MMVKAQRAYLAVKRVGPVAVVAPRGWLMGGEETEAIRMAVLDLLAAGNHCLVLDLADVQMANASAIGTLVHLDAAYRREGGRMVVCGISATMEKVLFVCGIWRMVMEIYPGLDEALRSFDGRFCPDWA